MAMKIVGVCTIALTVVVGGVWMMDDPKKVELRRDPIATTPTSATEYFHGHPCTVDCSGHEAGYQWASDRGIADEDDCTGNSESFIEGCKAFVEEEGGNISGADTDEQDRDN
jgi:hypothetical protein